MAVFSPHLLFTAPQVKQKALQSARDLPSSLCDLSLSPLPEAHVLGTLKLAARQALVESSALDSQEQVKECFSRHRRALISKVSC